jgi:hypothetical protein
MPTISGTVLDDAGDPVAGRVVRAYRRDTGDLLGSVQTSDGTVSVDPHLANVSLLLRFDGANNARVTTDSSSKNKTVTFLDYGGATAKISTDQSRFGGSSFFCEPGGGAGEYVEIPKDSDFDFGTGDFTIEFWFYYVTAPVASGEVFCLNRDGTNGGGVKLLVNPGGAGAQRLGIYITNDGDGTVSIINNQNVGTASYDIWQHYAIVRNGNNFNLYQDGVSIASATSSLSVYHNPSAPVRIGSSISFTVFRGYVDEVRVTKGVARYTANFTPPSVPFSTETLPVGLYQINTAHTGECNVVCLDDAAGTVYNDLILRTTPV